MPSPFDALDAALSRSVMSAFGETQAASLRPRTRAEYTEGPDATRPDRSISGVFSEGHDVSPLRGSSLGSEHTGVTRLSTQLAEFFLPAAEVALVPYAIKQGDKLAFPHRAGQPVYTISDIQKSDTGDLNLILVIGG